MISCWRASDLHPPLHKPSSETPLTSYRASMRETSCGEHQHFLLLFFKDDSTEYIKERKKQTRLANLKKHQGWELADSVSLQICFWANKPPLRTWQSDKEYICVSLAKSDRLRLLQGLHYNYISCHRRHGRKLHIVGLNTIQPGL